MPPQKRSRGPRTAARGKGPKRGASRFERKPEISFSRTKDVEGDNDEVEIQSEDEAEIIADEEEPSASEDEQTTPAQSYTSLLRMLKPRNPQSQPPSKRQKLDHAEDINGGRQGNNLSEDNTSAKDEDVSDVSELANVVHDSDSGSTDEEENEQDSDDEELVLQDPFEQHYANINEDDFNAAHEDQSKGSAGEKTTLQNGTRKIAMSHLQGYNKTSDKDARELKLKQRLVEVGAAVQSSLDDEEADLCREIFSYKDILCGTRSHHNATKFHAISALHALNHIYKTRDRILKNNAKLSQNADRDVDYDYNDQGFARPKVLILVPTKQACVRYIQSIVALSKPDQQENRGRFMDQFSQPEDETFENRPDDFRELFGGNHEEDFRVGLKFTRKTVKFFSGFYNSDIIFASPLGLMRTITTGGGKKDDKNTHDADFLSSIEIAIMDHANALEMQNWQHVDYVFSHLNLLPKESHGCDFSRVRSWYLDGRAKTLRQTIIFTNYLTPSISSLASAHLHNLAGRVKYTPRYGGAMLNLSAGMPLTLTQTFLRFASPSPQADSDARFKFFTATILPSLLRSSKQAKGTLIFTPTYLDFVRLRNHFTTAQETTSLSFGTVSEYSARGEVARARAHFLNGRHSVLLYSERAHHYFRYKLKGVRRVIFYGVPENPLFWSEIMDALGMNAQKDVEWAQSQRGKQGKGLVRALFSKWDVMKLERIVGTERVGRLVSEREGDIFEFA